MYDIKSHLYKTDFFDDLKTRFQIGGEYSDDANIYAYDEVYPNNELFNVYISKLFESYKNYNKLMNKINMFNELFKRYLNFRYYLFKINSGNEKYVIIDSMNIAILEYYYRLISQILNQINKGIDTKKNAYFDAYHLVTLNTLKFNIAPLIGIEYNYQNIDHDGTLVAALPNSVLQNVLVNKG